MATPKSKKPVKSSQDGANRSGEKVQRKAIPSETIMKSQRLVRRNRRTTNEEINYGCGRHQKEG